MRNRLNYAVIAVGIFILMTAMLFLFRFKLDVRTQHFSSPQLQAIFSLIVCALTYKTLSYFGKEDNIEEKGYNYFGDYIIKLLPITSFFVALGIENKVTWLCVMAFLIVIFFCLAYGHVRAVDAAIERVEARKKHMSPFLSGILVNHMGREQLLKIIELMKSEEKEETVIMRVSSTGADEWVLSFPQGVSIDSFMDAILEICLDVDEKNQVEYPSGNHGVRGYYQFIEGPMEGKMTMFTCEEEYDFKIVDEQGVNYIDVTTRKRLFRAFRKSTPRFVETDKKCEVFIPVNLKEIINNGKVIKQIRIYDYL
jgi:hypothetical protein